GQPTGGCVADCENFRKTCPYILPSGLASAVVRDTCGLGWSLCNDGDIPQLRHLIKIANDYVRDLEAKLAAQKQKVVG
ncbi:MAG: hypothetical protein LBL46_03210, partial [Rickettsiales bacterium]|nr:hypothetical protein [Rickettsiales bacterium]